MSATTREEMIRSAKSYVVINDGQNVYPVLRSDLREGDSATVIRGMDGDEYADWCNAVPADQRVAAAGTGEMSDLCDELIEAGATQWRVA